MLMMLVDEDASRATYIWSPPIPMGPTGDLLKQRAYPDHCPCRYCCYSNNRPRASWNRNDLDELEPVPSMECLLDSRRSPLFCSRDRPHSKELLVCWKIEKGNVFNFKTKTPQKQSPIPTSPNNVAVGRSHCLADKCESRQWPRER